MSRQVPSIDLWTMNAANLNAMSATRNELSTCLANEGMALAVAAEHLSACVDARAERDALRAEVAALKSAPAPKARPTVGEVGELVEALSRSPVTWRIMSYAEKKSLIASVWGGS